jgi:Uma2 family endonuclease
MRESMLPSVRARWADISPDDGPITVEEFLALPEDRWRFELISGRLVLRPQADLGSATIANGLAESIRLWAAGADTGGTTLAETGFVVSAPGELDTVYVPALAYLHDRRAEAGDDAAGMGSVRLVPDLVVEIASPAQQREELAERASGWLSAGVRLIWVIWPARRQVDVWRLEGDGAEVGKPTATPYSVDQMLQEFAELPGYSYPIAHLFY